MACVPKDQYDAALQDGQQMRGLLSQCSADMVKARADLAALNQALAQAQALADQEKKALADSTAADGELRAKLDNAIATGAQLKKELERLGKNADALLAEKGGARRARSPTPRRASRSSARRRRPPRRGRSFTRSCSRSSRR